MSKTKSILIIIMVLAICISPIYGASNDWAMFQQNVNHEGFIEEAESLKSATVHWLRHTGISNDVKFRPREHVRDDAGHSSSAITDKYIDIDERERYLSAKHKKWFSPFF